MKMDSKSHAPCKFYKLRQYTRRKNRPYYSVGIAIALFFGCTALVLEYAFVSSQNTQTLHQISKRSVDISNDTTGKPKPDTTSFPSIGNYPEDVFTPQQLRHGAVILHTAGMVYMFVALAIVCDEFFVPALEVIIDKLSLTEDVAGATFMAAGGSAPELFASIAGLFISQNSVGISTIIGSAVFNILFVIGACGLAAHELLHLTWWPLFRDSIFYSISLLVLIVSYLDWKIHYYEAIALLLCYASYVTFMVFNEKVEKVIKGALCRQRSDNSNADLVPVSHQTSLMYITNEGKKVSFGRQDQTRTRPASSLKFRAGLLQLMIHTIDPLAEGNIEDQASRLRSIALQKKISDPPSDSESPAATGAVIDQNGNKDSKLSAGNGVAKGHNALESTSSNHSSMTAVESIDEEASAMEMTTSKETPTKVAKVDTTATTNGYEVKVQTTTPENQRNENGGDGDDDDENAPLDLSWPKTAKKRISYILLAPIIFPLWLTLPDTRRPERRKFFLVTFFGSIAWIAGFAIMMVWWASVLCVTIGMPVEIIGLTVLAAGTSVPDLLTSVIVARKGFGDMAVSSSIGSNIFDITVGLPFPWLIGSLLKLPGGYVAVDAQGLLCSIVLLFCMLIAVIATIAIFKWRLSKPLGATYILLYAGFLACSVLLAYGKIPCIELSL